MKQKFRASWPHIKLDKKNFTGPNKLSYKCTFLPLKSIYFLESSNIDNFSPKYFFKIDRKLDNNTYTSGRPYAHRVMETPALWSNRSKL